jgi:catechol 2,3-dioxygenase-like lactoylglutathione lyase family enzyme
MIVKRAHHASLSVADIERARGFYEGVLGLSPIERPDFGFPGAWYQAGDIQLHLIQVPEGVDVGAPPSGTNPLAHHVAFEIEDYEATGSWADGEGATEPAEDGKRRRRAQRGGERQRASRGRRSRPRVAERSCGVAEPSARSRTHNFSASLRRR